MKCIFVLATVFVTVIDWTSLLVSRANAKESEHEINKLRCSTVIIIWYGSLRDVKSDLDSKVEKTTNEL